MTLITSTIGDNPQQPAGYSEIYNPDQLIAGNLKVVSQPILLIGSTPLPRGTVLGKVTNYGVETSAGQNTGNGTVGSVALGSGVLEGDYAIVATSAQNFSVTDPEGNVLAPAVVGTAYSAEGIGFTITAGATAFAVGDSFSVTVVDAIGSYQLCVKTASDGSQTPAAILADYADPSNGPITTGGYVMGEFNGNYLNYDDSWTPELLAFAFPSPIFIKSAVISANPGAATPAQT